EETPHDLAKLGHRRRGADRFSKLEEGLEIELAILVARPKRRLESRMPLGWRRRRRDGFDRPAVEAEKRVDDSRIVHGAAAIADDLERFGVLQFRTIRAIGGERVEAVDDRQNP